MEVVYLAISMVLLGWSCSAMETTDGQTQIECKHICHTDLMTVELYKELRALQERVRANEEELAKVKKMGDKPKVGFAASLGNVGNFGPFNTDVTLVYKDVLSNIGNAYSTATGIFTAPIKGFYYFAFSGHNESSKLMALKLFKNGQQIITVYNHPSVNHSYETASNSVCLNLEVGDQVYMRLHANTWVFDNPNHHTTFVSHLIFQE